MGETKLKRQIRRSKTRVRKITSISSYLASPLYTNRDIPKETKRWD